MIAPGTSQNPQDITGALSEVLTSILSFAKEQRQADPDYLHLFAEFKDGGVAKAVFEAERAMSTIAMNLSEILSQDGRKIDNDLYMILMGLPLAMRLVRKDVEAAEGWSCGADKTRLLLKTFVYERLGLDVEVIPFECSAPTDRSV